VALKEFVVDNYPEQTFARSARRHDTQGRVSDAAAFLHPGQRRMAAPTLVEPNALAFQSSASAV
jgi:hypothetical protein